MKRLLIFALFASALQAQVLHPRIWLDSPTLTRLKAQISFTHYGGTGLVDSAQFTAFLAAANTQAAQGVSPFDPSVVASGTIGYTYRGEGWYDGSNTQGGVPIVALAYAITGNTTYSTWTRCWLDTIADTGRLLSLTSTAGINVGDSVTGATIPGGTTVAAIYAANAATEATCSAGHTAYPTVRLSNYWAKPGTTTTLAAIPNDTAITFNGSNVQYTPGASGGATPAYANYWQGAPGYNLADPNGYGARFTFSTLALAYDWVYPALTSQEKTDLSAMLAVWVPLLNTYGYQWENPGSGGQTAWAQSTHCGNFPIGDLFGLTLAGIAFEGDASITSSIFSDVNYGVLTRLNTSVSGTPSVTAQMQGTGCLASGYPSESYQYGSGSYLRFALTGDALNTAGKSSLVTLYSAFLPWEQNVVDSELYEKTPDTWGISADGDWTGTYSGLIWSYLPYDLAGMIQSAAPESGYAYFQYANVNYANVPGGAPGVSNGFAPSPMDAFLWLPTEAPADYTAVLPTYWYGAGLGDYRSVARTDWTSAATWTIFNGNTSGYVWPTDHSYFEAGHLMIQRGSDRLLVSQAESWKGTNGVIGTEFGGPYSWGSNALFVSDPTVLHGHPVCPLGNATGSYLGCQYATNTATAHGPMAHKETATYVYSKLSMADVYGNPNAARAMSTYLRSFASVGGITFVYDYVVPTNYAAATRMQFWHTPNLASASPAGIASALSVSGNTASVTVGSSRLWIRTVLPPSPTITSVQDTGRANGPWYCSGCTPMYTQHFEVSDPAQSTSPATQYLTVLAPTASSVGSMPSTVAITAAGFAGALYADATPRAVLFSATGAAQNSFSYSITASGTVTHVIADMAPGTYTVYQGGTAIAVVTAGTDGTMTFTSSGGGSFSSIQGAEYTLTVTVTAPSGAGVVTGCGGSYIAGQAFICTAVPGAGSILAGWGGTCGGGVSGPSYSGTIPAGPCTVTAAFEAVEPGKFQATKVTGVQIQ